MQIYEELVARGLIAQVTNEEEIKKMVNEGKAVFYIGFDPTADSLHVGHFMADVYKRQGFGRALDSELMRAFGVTLDSIEARELIDKAKSFTDEECAPCLEEARDMMVGLDLSLIHI